MTDALTFPAPAPAGRTGGEPQPAALVGDSPAVRLLLQGLLQAAAGQGAVLLVAEPGSDVESLARQIHLRSRLAAGPFVAVDCSGRDPLELGRTLFGHGAPAGDPPGVELVDRESHLALAAGGTLLLRDADELPAPAQDRLARIARDGELRTTAQEAPFRTRLIAACTPGLEAQAERGRFRPDLYRRLSAARIEVPPLRRRREDLGAIATRLAEEICQVAGVAPKAFTQTALALLGALPWPGNLRELRSLMARLVTSVDAPTIRLEDLLAHLRLEATPAHPTPPGSLREARLRFEREYIASVLQRHHWRVGDAARALGIQRPNLYRKARQLGIVLMKAND
ncbi:MAG: sigma-54-dependent Fis family transcriptional regulator [Acidobacteriota bacterium]|nr:sigma-54-dependent Fis family transcriptional regulator [Acidobacteriota bacterium]